MRSSIPVDLDLIPAALMEIDLDNFIRLFGPPGLDPPPLDPATLGLYTRHIPGEFLLRVNRRCFELFGAESEEEFRSHLHLYCDTTALNEVRRCILTAAASDYSGEVPPVSPAVVVKRLDAAELRLRFSTGRPWQEGNSKVLLLSVEDLTEASQMRNQINQLSLLPEYNSDIVLFLECNARIVYANPAARKWVTSQGYGNIHTLHHLLPEEFAATECANCTRKDSREFFTTFKDRNFRGQISPVPGSNQCLVTISDITILTRLKNEREVYYQAFQNTTNPIFITDRAGHFEYINPAFEEFYGYTMEEITGALPSLLNPGKDYYYDQGFSHEQYDHLFSDLWARLEEDGHYEGMVVNRCKLGDHHWVKLMINSFALEETGAEKYLAIIIDMEASRRLEKETRIEVLTMINRIGELRDNETGNHMTRVGLYAQALARELGQAKKFCEDINLFAPLHDIGKVAIPDLILLAPRRLSDEEFEVIKTHPDTGFGLLDSTSSMAMGAEIAHGHHERWDGSGYPLGIRGEEIPLAARISAVADVYDALRSRRPYKDPWNHDKVCDELNRLAGSHFDPRVIEAFNKTHREFEEIFEHHRDTLPE